MERELREIMPRERTSQYNQGLIEVPDGAGRKEDTPHG
jgi:hypothetical protein